MRVVHPNVYLKQHQKARKKRKLRIVIMLFIALIIASYGFMAFSVKATYKPLPFDVSIGAQQVEAVWPALGSASLSYYGFEGQPIHSNGNVKRPSASTIKLLTALVVLQKKPLDSSESGELIEFTADDVKLQESLSTSGGAIFPITAGQTYTYRDALKVLLLVSANNFADKLAVWAYGDMDSYLEAARMYASDKRLTSTEVSDASGLSASTITSSNDLIKLANQALDDPIIRDIVSLKSVVLGDGRTIDNTNQILGNNNINGLKTGLTDEAGACLVVSREITVVDSTFTILLVIMGQTDRTTLYAESLRLLDDYAQNFVEVSLLARNQNVAKFLAPWGEEVMVKNRDEVNIVRYKGESFNASFNMDSITSGRAFDQVGVLTATTQSKTKKVELELADDVPEPPLMWRLRHAFDYFEQI